MVFSSTIVTIYGKTQNMGFSVKIEFDVSLVSSILELLTYKLEAARVLHFVHNLSTHIEIEKL